MIEQIEEGVFYRTKIMMLYKDADGQDITFLSDPDNLYEIIHREIVRISNLGIAPGMDMETMKRKRLAALIKAGVKALLLLYGDQLLDILFNTPDHPTPTKGVDILDWYTDIFTRVAISHAMKNDFILEGQFIGKHIVEVVAIGTRPVTPPASIDTTATGV